jgi:hypothetical protein
MMIGPNGGRVLPANLSARGFLRSLHSLVFFENGVCSNTMKNHDIKKDTHQINHP